MKNVVHIISLLFVITFLTSCSPTKKLTKGYFQTDKRIGIVLNENEFYVSKERVVSGSNPLVMVAGIGISKLLNRPDPAAEISIQAAITKNNPELGKEVLGLFKKAHELNNLNFKVLDINLDSIDLEEFDKTFIKRKQAKLDYRLIGEKYNLDYLLIIDTKNFLTLQNLQKILSFEVMCIVLDMEDNSYRYFSRYKKSRGFYGDWKDAPEYPDLMILHNRLIDKVFDNMNSNIK